MFNKQSIEAINAVSLPDNLTEDMYIFVYRKQHAQIRHHSYKVLAEFGGNTSKDPRVEQDITHKIIEVQRKKEEYLKLACNLYKVQ